MNDCICNKLSGNAGRFVDITGLCNLADIDLNKSNSWTQISIPTVFTIPQQKPDMGELHAENITVEIIRKKVIVTPAGPTPSGSTIQETAENWESKIVTGRKLIVEGLICKSITYTALREDQPMHTAEASIPFSAYIVLPKPTASEDPLNFNYEVIPCIEDVFIKEICDRQIFQNITLFLQAVKAKGTTCEEEHCGQIDQVAIKGVATPEQLKAIKLDNVPQNPLPAGKTDNAAWTQFVISENLILPHTKPNIEQINSLHSYVDIISQRVVNTPPKTGIPENHEGTKLTGKKLIIEGVLRQKITYTADVLSGSQPVHSAHFDVPFSAFIVMNPTTIGSDIFKIEPYIEDIFVCAVDKRQVFKNTVIFIKATKCV